MKRAIFSSLLFAAIAAASMSAFGQSTVVYKSMMPDGRIVYGDAPVKGAKVVKRQVYEIANSGLAPIMEISGSRASTISALDRRFEQRQINLDDAFAELRAAEQALREAQAAQAASFEPDKFDRTGIVSPRSAAATGVSSGSSAPGQNKRYSRLNQNYWEYQQQLADAVVMARERVAQARATMDAFK